MVKGDPLTFAQGNREIEVQVGSTTTVPASPQLPQAVGTQSEITYSTSGLPTWLAVDLSTRRVTVDGTISELDGLLVSFDWIAKHSDGRTATERIYVNIKPQAAVEELSFAQGDVRIGLQTGSTDIEPNSPQLPQATGADNITYTSPGKPNFLSIDSNRRVTITAGKTIPEVTHPLQHSFRWVATDDDGVAAEASVNITVFIAARPDTPELSFSQGDVRIGLQTGSTDIEPNSPQLPQATGADNITYTSPSKPDFLSIDSNRRVTITTGKTIPEVTHPLQHSFRWVATDDDGVATETSVNITVFIASATLSTPPKPTSVTATTVNNTSIRVAFTQSTTYRTLIQWGEPDSSPFIVISQVMLPKRAPGRYEIEGLDPSTEYEIRVSYLNDNDVAGPYFQ